MERYIREINYRFAVNESLLNANIYTWLNLTFSGFMFHL